jgi:DNA-binding MarR family transcriptional regulator
MPGHPLTTHAEVLADELLATARLLWQATYAPPTRPGGAFDKLRPRHVQLLQVLTRRPGLSVRAAAECLSMRPHNVSTLVTDLVNAGLVERRADPADRRVARLHPSDAAREQVDALDRELRATLVGALRRLTDVDRGRIGAAMPALHRVVAGLPPQSM